MKEKYDIIAIGMGPGAIFLAYEMIKLNKNKKILFRYTNVTVAKKK